jgi:hypothetical protein
MTNILFRKEMLPVTCLKKVTSAFRQLAYGVPVDYVDEYMRMGECTAIVSEEICESNL